MVQRPIAIGLMLCDQVIAEEKTGNITPVNCFGRRLVAEFPSEPVSFVVFSMLTDGSGEIPLEVVLQRLDNLEELIAIRYRVKFTNPLQNIRCIFRVNGLSFPVAGAYQVSLFAEKEQIAQRRFVVLQKEKKA